MMRRRALTRGHIKAQNDTMRVEQMIGKRVRQAREEADLSQREFGERVGDVLGKRWTPQAVSQAEKGERDWRAKDLVAMAWILRRPVAWFYTPNEEDRSEMLEGFAEGVLIHAEWTSGDTWARREVGELFEEAADLRRQFEELLSRLDKAGRGIEEIEKQAKRGVT
jgi:transcriptional regulator with XRE-family HTH domain